jgi:3-methylcrotonyl-CoA carboxylase beta subunit
MADILAFQTISPKMKKRHFTWVAT